MLQKLIAKHLDQEVSLEDNTFQRNLLKSPFRAFFYAFLFTLSNKSTPDKKNNPIKIMALRILPVT